MGKIFMISDLLLPHFITWSKSQFGVSKTSETSALAGMWTEEGFFLGVLVLRMQNVQREIASYLVWFQVL